MQPFKIEVVEGSTPRYVAKLVDELGNAISASSLYSARLTLYSTLSGQIINGRNAQNVLNANDVTISNDGDLTWWLRVPDVTIIDNVNVSSVIHRAVFAFEWYDSVGLLRRFVRLVDIHIWRWS